MLFFLVLCFMDSPGSQKAEVMLLGTFHFSNPKKDVVKTDQINVMTEENQKVLRELSQRLANFKPTCILLEFNPEKTAEIQMQYKSYIEGDFTLPSNEVYQLGFRIAKLSGLKTIVSFDEREVGWKGGTLMEVMEKEDPQTKKRFDELVARVTSQMTEDHKTKSLLELLNKTNTPEEDLLNQYFYILTNHVGAGEGFVGADAAASWWHRNFRMYALVQKYAKPGERVLVIGGQGHTAILRDLLNKDFDRIAADPRPFILEQ